MTTADITNQSLYSTKLPFHLTVYQVQKKTAKGSIVLKRQKHHKRLQGSLFKSLEAQDMFLIVSAAHKAPVVKFIHSMMSFACGTSDPMTLCSEV